MIRSMLKIIMYSTYNSMHHSKHKIFPLYGSCIFWFHKNINMHSFRVQPRWSILWSKIPLKKHCGGFQFYRQHTGPRYDWRCVKSARIRIFSCPYFPAFGPHMKYLSVFSPNGGKYRPEKLQIRTLFMQWRVLLSTSFTAEYDFDFVVTQENTNSQRFHFKTNRETIGSSEKRYKRLWKQLSV